MGERFAINDGVRIAWEWRAPRTEPDVVPVVLVHGLGYARWGWEPVVDALAATRPVILMDNRGIGASEVPPGPYTAQQMATDVLAVVDAAGADRFHLVGASLGGMVAQHVARSRPASVVSLVLVCTTPGGERSVPIPRATLDLIGRMPQMDPLEAITAAADNALGDIAGDARRRIVERIVGHRTAEPQDPAGWQAQAHAGTTHALGDGVADIACPTLVVHGTADNVVDPGNADVLVELLPDARAHLMAGAGHLCFWERPDEFVRVVSDFLG